MSKNISSPITGVLVYSLLLFGLFSTGWTQGRDDSGWAVGGNRLPFNSFNDSLSAETNPLPTTVGPGGSAVANDPVTGELLFYADGAGLYDAQGNQQATFGGDAAANQPVTVVPVPGDDATDGNRQYYVFVNEGGTINYYTVTVSLPTQGPPSVASVSAPTSTGITGAANAMTIVPNEDNSNAWLVTQEDGTANMAVFDVANLSVVGTGNGISPQASDANNIAYSKATGQLAVADGQGVRFVNIDPASGQLSYVSDVSIPAEVYDTEWSPDGSKLYASTGADGNVYQYDTTTGTLVPISNQVPGEANYGLQRGPDGSVYYVYETAGGERQLGRINSADSAATLLSVESALLGGIDLGGQQFSTTASLGVDLSNVTLQPTTVGACTNNPVQLVPNILLNGGTPQPDNGIPDPDSIVWFIDGERYVGFSPTLVPEQVPSVQVTAYWEDDSVSAGPFPLPLQDFQLQVPVVQDTTICPEEILELCAAPQDGGGQQGGGQGGVNIPIGGGQGGQQNCEAGNYTYLWSTGATTPDIEVDEAGIYWVLITDPSTGCTAYAESNVKEYQVENQTYNEWYFGDGGGINFNTLYDDPDNDDDNDDGEDNDGQITGLGDGDVDAPEGVEAVSDPNGDILFYTDGQTVWFVSKDPDTGENVHTEMPIADNPSGTGIGGSPEASQVVSIPVPGTDASYYIFTTTAVEDGGYELNYSIVDLRGSQASPGPSVVSSNNLLFVKSTERIAIQGGNGGPATLVAHEYGTNNFRAYPITEAGIGNPVISSAGSVHSYDTPEDAQGYIKFGGDSTGALVAVALDDRVEVFNFDTETLEISDPVTIDFAGQGQPYGVEFATDSMGNTVMYVSTDNGIYGATVDGPIEEGETISTVLVDGTGGTTYGAIQRGPDGQIYVAQPGQTNIGTLSPNPNDPANSGYNAEALPNGLPNGAVSGLGLPTYVSQGGNSFPEPSISVEDACVGNETNFSATGRDESIEEYSWEIIRLNDDGTRLTYALPDSLRTEQTFTYAIDTTGNFLARVTLTNKCDEDTVLEQEFIMNVAAEVTLPESINLCNGDVDLTAIDPAEDDGSYTFEWIRVGGVGESYPNQNTITVSEEGRYLVTVTNDEGCVSDGEVLVVDNRPDVALPDDFTLCQNEERELDVETPSPGTPGYEWDVLNEAGTSIFTSNEPVLEVSEVTPDAGIYTYTVTVTDDAPEGCFVQDTVVVTIQEAPTFDAAPVASQCGATTGSINVSVTSDPAETYVYTISDDAGSTVGSGTGLTFNQSDLPSGIYRVTVTNGAGCSTSESVGIDDSDVDFSVEATPVPQCDDQSYFILALTSTAASIVGSDISYSITDEDGTVVVPAQPLGIAMPPESSTVPVNRPEPGSLTPGIYNFEFVGDNGLGCRFTLANQEIPEPDSVDFTFVDDPIQGCGVTATIAVNYDPAVDNWLFSWEDEEGNTISNLEGQPSLEVSQSGTYFVTVTDRNELVCPSTQEVDVFLNEPFDINIEVLEPDNSCETGERQLTVNFIPAESENRDFAYTWTLDGNPIPNATRTITATESGDYSVRVRERNSACFATDLEPVNVNQPLSVNVFYSNACADGSDIALFAEVRTDGTDSLQYAWFSPTGERLAASSDTLMVRPDFPEGEYRVEVTSLVDGAVGCSTGTAAGFVRNPVPTTNLSVGPLTICPRDPDPEVNSILLEVSPAPEIRWTTPKGEFINTVDVTADVGGVYVIEATNEFGCTTIDSVEVIEDCSPSITAPNAFRPGGVNSEFFVYHKYVSTDDFEVKIYNRWGELVYQSNERDFRWDGTYNGREVPLGTYPYVILFKSDTEDTSNNILEERGGITVIR